MAGDMLYWFERKTGRFTNHFWTLKLWVAFLPGSTSLNSVALQHFRNARNITVFGERPRTSESPRRL